MYLSISRRIKTYHLSTSCFCDTIWAEEMGNEVIVWVHIWVSVNSILDQVYIGKGTILVDKK